MYICVSSTLQAPAPSSILGHSRTVHVEAPMQPRQTPLPTHQPSNLVSEVKAPRFELFFPHSPLFHSNSAKGKTTTRTKALHESTYTGPSKVVKPSDREESGGCHGLGEGEIGRRSTGVKFRSCEMSKFWRPALQHTTVKNAGSYTYQESRSHVKHSYHNKKYKITKQKPTKSSWKNRSPTRISSA